MPIPSWTAPRCSRRQTAGKPSRATGRTRCRPATRPPKWQKSAQKCERTSQLRALAFERFSPGPHAPWSRVDRDASPSAPARFTAAPGIAAPNTGGELWAGTTLRPFPRTRDHRVPVRLDAHRSGLTARCVRSERVAETFRARPEAQGIRCALRDACSHDPSWRLVYVTATTATTDVTEAVEGLRDESVCVVAVGTPL